MHARARQRRCSVLPALACAMVAVSPSVSLADSQGPVVWYRASEECPSGVEFLSKLSGRASGARVAQAGDHLDFIVTLVAASGETVGRLERQTRGGTVAIRELRDASCSRVADALALSLALALEPAGSSNGRLADASANPPEGTPNSQPESGQATSSPPRETPSSEPTPAARTAPAPVARQVPGDATGDAESPITKSNSWWIGAQGGGVTGLAPDPLARAAAFVDAEAALRSLAPRLSFRFAVVGVLGSTSTEVGSVRRWVLGGRLEGCPWRWGGASSIRPCLAFELGANGAQGKRASGLHDAGLWAAPGAAVRGELALAFRLRLQADVGALLPLSRNDVYAGSQALYQADIASFHAALGLALGLP